jgi:hypothetical protein
MRTDSWCLGNLHKLTQIPWWGLLHFVISTWTQCHHSYISNRTPKQKTACSVVTYRIFLYNEVILVHSHYHLRVVSWETVILCVSWASSQDRFLFWHWCDNSFKICDHTILKMLPFICHFLPVEKTYWIRFVCFSCILPSIVIFNTHFCLWDFKISWQGLWEDCCVLGWDAVYTDRSLLAA